MKMNTKILVALVIAFALVGMTGVVSAGYISTNTEMIGTYLTSESRTSVSGMPVEYSSESLLVAELVYPTYPEVDMSWYSSMLEGSDFRVFSSITSSPTGSTDEYEIVNPTMLEGYTTFFNCAMWGAGDPQRVILLPTDENEPLYVGWFSSHGEGGAYPTAISQSYNIYWP